MRQEDKLELLRVRNYPPANPYVFDQTNRDAVIIKCLSCMVENNLSRDLVTRVIDLAPALSAASIASSPNAPEPRMTIACNKYWLFLTGKLLKGLDTTYSA